MFLVIVFAVWYVVHLALNQSIEGKALIHSRTCSLSWHTSQSLIFSANWSNICVKIPQVQTFPLSLAFWLSLTEAMNGIANPLPALYLKGFWSFRLLPLPPTVGACAMCDQQLLSILGLYMPSEQSRVLAESSMKLEWLKLIAKHVYQYNII